MYRCPIALLDHDGAHLMVLWRAYHDHGIMPAPGGLLDQTHAFVEAIGAIEAGVRRAR